MYIDVQVLAASVVAVLAILTLYRTYRGRFLYYIRGPESNSFLFGHLLDLRYAPAGDLQYKWQDEFGSVIHIKGLFGTDKLLLSNPKALQYIFHTSAYSFMKPSTSRAVIYTMDGPDLVWAEGDIHKRQRKVMLPEFGAPEARALFPVFKVCIDHLIARWKDMIAASPDGNCITTNIHDVLGRTTLDTIEEAAFDYKIGAMDEDTTALGKVYRNFSILYILSTYLPSKSLVRLREHKVTAHKIAKQLIETKGKELEDGKSGKDILSLLVKANMSMASKHKLTDEELYAEMRMNFSTGTWSCIGWHFAGLFREFSACSMAEVQCFFYELISNFNFQVAPGTMDMEKVGSGLITPRLRSDRGKGTHTLGRRDSPTS
ncbi:cytochrome P450 [Heliocybe sulcata]|uniref:Cytochrome P450 n=1 Tax=Heliocybe sulcata TaxID=5364 RepID=A0A5C3MJ32_9AGAM|nr:cytochrome P450 [Heliocybe sulcata]